MENRIVTINETRLPVKEYQGKRVVTMKEIDAVHQRPEGTARKRFNDNKGHFIEGVDYFKASASDFRTQCDPAYSRQPELTSGTVEVAGGTYELLRGSKARNPDGTVNYTRLELV